uniref:FERM domain-containing protein 8 n=1 Tax=Pediculus humanus subsp. corporis TaxID=121224 RepID=A0A1S4MXK8_PEDHC
MNSELSNTINPGKDGDVTRQIKNEINVVPVLVESSSSCIMTLESTSYVTVEGGRYAGDFSSYLRDREKSEYHSQDQLYTLSQRFDPPGNVTLQDVSPKIVSSDDEQQNNLRQNIDSADGTEVQDGKNYKRKLNVEKLINKNGGKLLFILFIFSALNVCIYLMSKIALHMELEDGINCTAHDMIQAILQEEELGLPRSAGNVFSLWMCSGLVELQLKPHHRPYEIRQRWFELVERFSNASDSRKRRDEPSLSYQRNVFLLKKDEEQIKDQKILELLYEESKYNILEGRYPCEMMHYISLGAIQAKIELGPYNPQIHTIQFFRENQRRFLPGHIIKTAWSWLRISGKNSPEVGLLEQYKKIPPTTPVKKLVQKYLAFCWTLPFYGSAFFQGQVEQPVRGLTSLITHQDLLVLIAINSQGVYIIDHIQCTLLLGLKYKDMSWDYAKPSQENNPDCLPCLFIQFIVLENGTRVSKILQVFSKQAVMMDTLISTFVEESKRISDDLDGSNNTSTGDNDEAQMPLNARRDLGPSCLCNKLSKLTLATFDDDGHCIGKSGSWSFSY